MEIIVLLGVPINTPGGAVVMTTEKSSISSGSSSRTIEIGRHTRYSSGLNWMGIPLSGRKSAPPVITKCSISDKTLGVGVKGFHL